MNEPPTVEEIEATVKVLRWQAGKCADIKPDVDDTVRSHGNRTAKELCEYSNLFADCAAKIRKALYETWQ